MKDEARVIAGKLSKAQREAVLAAQFCEERGVWHPAGHYLSADKRVRYNLARKGVIRDYIRRSNRLTPIGAAVRTILQEECR